MATEKLPPIHPGEVLRGDFLAPIKLSPYAIGVPRTRIERLARCKTPVTADTALRPREISWNNRGVLDGHASAIRS